jgi:hypothetical protein
MVCEYFKVKSMSHYLPGRRGSEWAMHETLT